MTPESVIGKGRAKQKAEDTLASRLSRVAYASPRKAPSKDRTSRFWFRMDHKELEVTKEMMRPKEVEHIDSQVVKRLSRYRKSSPADFQKYIVRVREFFLKEIAPRTIAASGGTAQATEVLTRLLDTDVDSSTVERFNMMLNRATTLKMAQFVANYFGLPSDSIHTIIGSKEQPPPTNDLLLEMLAAKTAKTVEQSMMKMEKRRAPEGRHEKQKI